MCIRDSFKPTGDLARALEYWLDEHRAVWTAQHVALYGNVVKALSEGIDRIKALKNPKSSRALIVALGESTAAMQAAAAQQAEAAVLEIEKEMQSAGIPVEQLKVKIKKSVQTQLNPEKLKSEAKLNKPKLDKTKQDQSVSHELVAEEVAANQINLDEVAVFGQQQFTNDESAASDLAKLTANQEVQAPIASSVVDQELSLIHI